MGKILKDEPLAGFEGLITGTLKVIDPIDKRDHSHRVIWKAGCYCSEYVYFAKPDLEKLASRCECTGHPAVAKPLEEFNLPPDNRDTPEHAATAAAWGHRRHPEQTKIEMNSPLINRRLQSPQKSSRPQWYRCKTVALLKDLKVSAGQV